jgi:hypothetical protein
MKASTLVRKIEKAGGSFEVRHGLVYPLRVPARYRSDPQKMRYLVLALIREREATIRWERSGRNPNWWRDDGPVPISDLTRSEDVGRG